MVQKSKKTEQLSTFILSCENGRAEYFWAQIHSVCVEYYNNTYKEKSIWIPIHLQQTLKLRQGI